MLVVDVQILEVWLRVGRGGEESAEEFCALAIRVESEFELLREPLFLRENRGAFELILELQDREWDHQLENVLLEKFFT